MIGRQKATDTVAVAQRLFDRGNIEDAAWLQCSGMTPEDWADVASLGRFYWGKRPGAVEDLRSRAVEPHDVVPAVRDR